MIYELDRMITLSGNNQNQMRDIFQVFRYDTMNKIDREKKGGGRLSKEGSILGFLLGGTRFMHGTLWCTCFHMYGSFWPLIGMVWCIFGLWVIHSRWYLPFQCFRVKKSWRILKGYERNISRLRRLWSLWERCPIVIVGRRDIGQQNNILFYW